jgi:hypothetical protein
MSRSFTLLTTDAFLELLTEQKVYAGQMDGRIGRQTDRPTDRQTNIVHGKTNQNKRKTFGQVQVLRSQGIYKASS